MWQTELEKKNSVHFLIGRKEHLVVSNTKNDEEAGDDDDDKDKDGDDDDDDFDDYNI